MKKLIFLLSALVMSGCSSTPEKPGMTERELAEWKQLKPSIKRLVAIEGDLKELIVALDDMGKQQTAERQSKLENDNVKVFTTERVAFEEKTAVEVTANEAVAKTLPDQDTLPTESTQRVVAAPEPSPQSVTAVEPDASAVVGMETVLNAPKLQLTKRVYAVQLASLKDIESTKHVWAILKKKHPVLLEDTDALVEQALVKNINFFRLKASGFESRKEASNLCQQLRDAGSSCIVTPTGGEPIDQLIAKI